MLVSRDWECEPNAFSLYTSGTIEIAKTGSLSRMNNYSTAYGINDYGECRIEVLLYDSQVHCYYLMDLFAADNI